jgi:hypothetical protein
MWISAWTGRPAYAAIQALKPAVPVIVWIWLMSGGAIRSLSARPSNVMAAFIVLALFSGLFGNFTSRRKLRQKLARELGLIACAPIPSRGDKRFKKWDPDLIFPPGRWGELLLRPADPKPSRSRWRSETRATPLRRFVDARPPRHR